MDQKLLISLLFWTTAVNCRIIQDEVIADLGPLNSYIISNLKRHPESLSVDKDKSDTPKNGFSLSLNPFLITNPQNLEKIINNPDKNRSWNEAPLGIKKYASRLTSPDPERNKIKTIISSDLGPYRDHSFADRMEKAKIDKAFKENPEDMYSSIPVALTNVTNFIANTGSVCKSLNVQLYESDLKIEPKMEPDWLHGAFRAGICPYRWKRHYLGDDAYPRDVFELECLCNNSKCSTKGLDFRCIAVTYTLNILRESYLNWVTGATKSYDLDVEKITIACICAQRPSLQSLNAKMLKLYK